VAPRAPPQQIQGHDRRRALGSDDELWGLITARAQGLLPNPDTPPPAREHAYDAKKRRQKFPVRPDGRKYNKHKSKDNKHVIVDEGAKNNSKNKKKTKTVAKSKSRNRKKMRKSDDVPA